MNDDISPFPSCFPVPGFRLSAIASGMRYVTFDLGLVVADGPCASAGVFTRNLCAAAPVIWSRRVTDARAILVNSGQANAQTGEPGMADCAASAEAVSELTGIPASQIFLASTGVIGQRIRMDKMMKAIPDLVKGLDGSKLDEFSVSILTTDTVPKACRLTLPMGGETDCTIWGCVKGAGMISPNMATMLCFILTDVPVAPAYLQDALRRAAETTFNRITVDGDTSTNDSVMILSSLAGPLPPLESPASPNAGLFEEKLGELMQYLATRVIDDAEGATKTVTVTVRKAETDEQAMAAARAIANSPLVKTAFYGKDANWGRIMCALGYSGASLDPYKVDLYLDDVHWVKDGMDNGHETEAVDVMGNESFTLTALLNRGEGNATVLTCDLTDEYVKINASYRS
ncbi:MAG: bifunctional glutamate N-acetyltransferase/amino-acid acetyltransferase ArgJ [Deltaproteobacteria bacterium]|jgi:glutamate N-acetyltransferase/amino-acid N-acetyltransferase|nr:bifunctional glutamate N-acetyltransferase/amino-acid acetyltransferase ArgJ [Deltaproteobacteria bacterium]